MKIGPRSANEICQDYYEFCREMESLTDRILGASVDKKRHDEVGQLLAEFSTTAQSKTLETWVEIAAQLAELNQHFKEKKA
jgi:hypothetical protein